MTMYCQIPFKRLSIEFNGNVTFCCSLYNNNYFIGNIFTDEIDDIWYNEKATEFRKSILDGTYKFCNLNICGDRFEYSEELDGKNKDALLKPSYPKIVNLSYNPSCNVRCKTCRDELMVETKKDTEHLNSINDKIVTLCQNAEIIYLNGDGELFTSPHLKSLVQRLIKEYPNLKFDIHTNGLLCDEAHIKEWGLQDRIKKINISIHAATKKTYESIVRGGHWEQLQKNLKYLSTLKCDLNLIFVLHSLNYKEMPAFVEMANNLGALALFWRFRNWGRTQMCRDIDKYSCWEPTHPDYKNFLKVLNKLKRMKKYEYKYILIEEYLKRLQSQTVNPWWFRSLKGKK